MIVKIQVGYMDLRTGPAGREHLVKKDTHGTTAFLGFSGFYLPKDALPKV